MTKNNILNLYYFTLIGVSLIMLLLSIQTSILVRLLFFIIAWLPLFVNKYANKYYVPSVFLYSLVINDNLMEGVSFLPSSQSYFYYTIALIIILIINISIFDNGATIGKKYFLFVIVCFYFAAIDIINKGEIGRYALLFMYILFIYPFLNSRKTINYVLITYVMIAVKLSILLFVLKDQFAHSLSGLERYSWIDPNYFASTIGIGFTIALLYSLRYIEIKNILVKRNILVVIQFLSLTTIALTASRGAIVGVGIVLIITLLYSNLKTYKKFIFILSFTIIVLSMLVLGYFDVIVYRFVEEDTLNSGSYRTLIWGNIFKGFFALPIYSQLFGSGYEYSMVLSNGMLAHNEFIGLLSDYGIVGVGLVVLILKNCFTSKKIFLSSSNILLVYFLLIAMTLNPIRTVAFSMLLLIIFKLKESNQMNIFISLINRKEL
jgi:hypothetical protein